ncbi:hypothetical protein PR202_gb19441 [Eleusine coracana subsp. coracana]|uniref:PGG domain-containing protein n=1 Tax=Eleusine coracana subsp. coracana TaxID=191504 RepID=A0AAV5F836_ELECO|nr:hypothetical protein PR202_gb19441 [Eleusine coracana subsp. coracana]
MEVKNQAGEDRPAAHQPEQTMDSPRAATRRKKMTKQLTGKRDDTAMHAAARAGQVGSVREMLSGKTPEELGALLSKQNQAGETPLFVAAEYGYVDLVGEMVKYHDVATAGIKARSGYDALHIAAKQGDVDVVKALLEALPELSMTVDASNTTALNTAATQGHMEVVRLLLQVDGSLALIARSNGKTAVHSAARNGHVEVVRALLQAEPSIALRTDKKGQTALHMAAKGTRLDLVDALLAAEPALLNVTDNKGNTALHIASRKARHQIIRRLLDLPDTDLKAINRSRETALDTAEKMGNAEVAGILAARGVVSARAMSPAGGGGELKQQGSNNAINSTTVVAVLIATVAFAAIFTVPGEYVEDPSSLAPGQALGEANIAHDKAFIIFFVFDSVSLFISLAVVVVQTSVVVIERKAKKQMMAVINKLMWVACVLISVAFLALSFVVVGRSERWLAVAVTIMGATILVTTIGTMLYWVIAHRMEAKRMRTMKRNSLSRSRSFSCSGVSEGEWIDEEFKRMYAI